MPITSKQGQWLGDIAVRESGSIESVFEMAVKSDISITEKVAVNIPLEKPTAISKRVMNFYNINNIHPATSTEVKGMGFGGIGYMAVEINFIVS